MVFCEEPMPCGKWIYTGKYAIFSLAMAKILKEEKYTYTPVLKTSGAIPLWFCFPSTYAVGMAALGYLHLFRILDENPDVSPERIFTDTEKTVHLPKTLELIGFSFSFEFDFLGTFKILGKHKIPFRSEDRGDEFPLVFGGGAVLSANPEPFADFFDFIIVGEGEEIIKEIIQAYKEVRNCGNKREKLLRLSEIEGIYVPSLYKPEYNPDETLKQLVKVADNAPESINKRYIGNLQESLYTPIIAEKAVFPNMFMVETARGCPKRCRFCIACYLTLPSRYPCFESIKNAIDIGLGHSAKIGLLGALITEHPDFDKICQYILEKKKEKDFEISVSSLRIDKITPLIIKTLVKCGQRQNTVAIEAGTDRLRKVINKNLSEEAIFEGVKIASENGLKGLKIYGMTGFPTETFEDIEKLAGLMIRLKKENKGFNLALNVNSFVPKAQTPFQWSERASGRELEAKNNYLRKELNTHKVHYKPSSIKSDFIQAVLSRGDRRLFRLIEKVYSFGGTLGSWNRAYRELTRNEHINIPDFDWYGLRKRSFEEVLPWSLINTGIRRDSLIKEAEAAYT